MIGALFFILFAYGVTNMLVYSNGPFGIIDSFRNIVGELNEQIGEMFECMICTSANVGWISSALLMAFGYRITPGAFVFGGDWWMAIPFDLFATSGAVWLMHSAQKAMEGENEL